MILLLCHKALQGFQRYQLSQDNLMTALRNKSPPTHSPPKPEALVLQVLVFSWFILFYKFPKVVATIVLIYHPCSATAPALLYLKYHNSQRNTRAFAYRTGCKHHPVLNFSTLLIKRAARSGVSIFAHFESAISFSISERSKLLIAARSFLNFLNPPGPSWNLILKITC